MSDSRGIDEDELGKFIGGSNSVNEVLKKWIDYFNYNNRADELSLSDIANNHCSDPSCTLCRGEDKITVIAGCHGMEMVVIIHKGRIWFLCAECGTVLKYITLESSLDDSAAEEALSFWEDMLNNKEDE